MSRKHHSRPHSHRSRSTLSSRWGIPAVLIFLALLAAIVFLMKPESAAPLEIGVDEAYQAYQDGAFVLDVREQEEWDAFHIPGTTLIPLSQLADRLDEVPTDREIVVVCRSGNRSQSGRDILLEAGYGNVTSMSGGVTAWSNAGYPIDGTRP
jgi:rhodanese-related sulfurtransferase